MREYPHRSPACQDLSRWPRSSLPPRGRAPPGAGLHRRRLVVAVPAAAARLLRDLGQLAYGASFLFNPYNLQSIALFAAMPLLLGPRPDLRHHRRRHRPVGRLRHGPGRGRHGARDAVADPAIAGPGAGWRACSAPCWSALVPGLINGTLISRLRVPAFIGTLGMYGVARGVGFLAANGTTVPVNNPWLFADGQRQAPGRPDPAGDHGRRWSASCTGRLSQTRFGQYTYAIGGNRIAAVAPGINVRRHTLCCTRSAPPAPVWPARSTPPASRPAPPRRASRCCSTASPPS